MSKRLGLSGVPTRDALLREAVRLGCEVTTVNRTGEVRVTHRYWPTPIRMNNRRKDGSQVLVKMLRSLQQREEVN